MRNDTTYRPTRNYAMCVGYGVVATVGVIAWKANRPAGSRDDDAQTAQQPFSVLS